MMDLFALRQGLAANAATIAGLRTYAYVPDSISPPTFFVGEPTINFDGAFKRGLDTVIFVCRLMASRADDRNGQRTLDGFLSGSGGGALKTALESDHTLGGACDDLIVTSITNYGGYDYNNVEFYGAEISVTVIGSG